MSNTPDAEDEAQSMHAGSGGPAIPEEWSDVDPTIVPLFEETIAWFENIYEQFYFSTGGVGQACNLTPEAVEFSRYECVEEGAGHFEAVTSRYAESDTIGDALVVNDREEAEEVGQQATWVQTEGCDRFWLYERVPFSSRVVTTDGLEEELGEIMENHPDFEELFEESATVAEDIFGIDQTILTNARVNDYRSSAEQQAGQAVYARVQVGCPLCGCTSLEGYDGGSDGVAGHVWHATCEGCGADLTVEYAAIDVRAYRSPSAGEENGYPGEVECESGVACGATTVGLHPYPSPCNRAHDLPDDGDEERERVTRNRRASADGDQTQLGETSS